jgi:hypothetical protein
MLLALLSEVIRLACMSFCEMSDTDAGSCLNLLVSFGDAIITTSSMSMTLVVSSGRVNANVFAMLKNSTTE